MKLQYTQFSKRVFIFMILLIAFLLPRVFSLGRFVAVDEVNWLHRSANFYNAMVEHEWSNTYVSNHPGIITSWVGALAFRIAAPDYRVTNESMVTSYTAFEEKLSKVVGLKPIFFNIYLLAIARSIMISLLTALLLVCFFYAQRLFGVLPSLLGFLIIALDPFFIALTRMNHLDAPQAVFMFLSVLAFLNYLFRGNRWFDLVVSGIAGGLAFLAKLPGIFIVPTIGFVAIFGYLKSRPVNRIDSSLFANRSLKKLIQSLLSWALVFMVSYSAFWPAMWAHPVKNMEKLLASSSSEFASTIIDESDSELDIGTDFSSGQTLAEYLRYPISFLWRTTPVVLLGLLLLIFYYLRKNDPMAETHINGVQGLILLVVVYTVGITIPSKSSEKYLAPAYLVVDLIAGFGWYYFVVSLTKGLRDFQRKYARIIIFTAVIMVQSIWVYQSFPYYFNYYNPLLGGISKAAQVKSIGVGEGLDIAGRYLMEKPNSSNLKVMAWYGVGPLSYFFDGDVDPIYMTNSGWTPEFIRRFRTMDYLVIYTNQKFRNKPPELFDLLSEISPEFTVAIRGGEYAWIYKVSDIPIAESELKFISILDTP